MKTLALLLSLGLMSTVASANPRHQAASATEKTHKVSAEVVSVDTMKNTLTVKSTDGGEKTVPVEGKAITTRVSTRP
jgi:VCBS repeat-containing protein